MKKYFVIPLLFIYALAISGIIIHAHYCGKHLVSVSLSLKGDPCNEGCNKKPMKCCKDKVIAFKVTNEQKSVSHFIVKAFTSGQEPSTLPNFIYYITALQEKRNGNLYNPNAPPGLWEQIPLYKLHSSFTYYG